MDISQYKSGAFRKQYGYQSFSPAKINHAWEITDPGIITLVSEADQKAAKLDTYARLIPDIDFFIQMHIAKEATDSSHIEGTRTTLEEVFQKEDQLDPEKQDDWQEVQNYIATMNYAIGQLDQLPLSNRLLRQTHKILLLGVRGKYKLPGEFRKSQNWISGANLKDAYFIPPHHTEVPELMSDLEKFLNNKELLIPHLIRIGIAHYQFETIHPFLDGNGRLGRLLITLYLVSNNILAKPALYLSDFLDRNRSLYYENLTIARTRNDLGQWLKFFLVGVAETAERSIRTFDGIIALKKRLEEDVLAPFGRRKGNAKKLLNFLYSHPVTTASEVADFLQVNPSTANRLIQEFEKSGILKEKTGYRRNRIFYFEEYLAVFR